MDIGFEFEPLVVGVKVNYNMIDNEGDKLGYFNYVKEPPKAKAESRGRMHQAYMQAAAALLLGPAGWLAFHPPSKSSVASHISLIKLFLSQLK